MTTGQPSASEHDRERLEALPYWPCPKCRTGLETVTLRDIQVDRCHSCNGIWLDEGELEQLAGEEPSLLQKIVGVFAHYGNQTKGKL